MDVPAVVQNKAHRFGAGDWLRDLPELVAAVAADGDLVVGAAFPDSSEAYVCAVTRADGTPAVLKLLMPRAAGVVEDEVTALRLADGSGCVALLKYDGSRGALLLERLGRSLFELQLPMTERHEILVSAARQMWRPAPGSGLPTGAHKAAWLAELIVRLWTDLGEPCTEQAVTYAVECADRRRDAHDDERAVLVHGDVHQWNALEARGGFKLVDPDGLLAAPEYDLGVIMREDPRELSLIDPHERSRRLAAITGLDETAIWEWGVVERVSTGLLCLSVDLEPHGSDMLAVAAAIATLSR
jgi:streptomycin 6-kinase